MYARNAALLLFALSLGCSRVRALEEWQHRPFVLPWDDGSAGPTDLIRLNDRPAGALGFVTVAPGGQLSVGGRRLRLFGVNIVGEAALPAPKDGELIARRLAKFGVNSVRVRGLDGIGRLIPGSGGTTRQLAPSALARLDAFVSALSKDGICLHLVLKADRIFVPGDGFGREITRVPGAWQRQLALWDGQALALEKEYVRLLLGHRNAQIARTYADNPAVAIIELTATPGVLEVWADRENPELADLPDLFLVPLRTRWRERCGRGDARIPARDEFADWDSSKRSEWTAFLRELECTYHRRMGAFLRDEIGTKSVVLLSGDPRHGSICCPDVAQGATAVERSGPGALTCCAPEELVCAAAHRQSDVPFLMLGYGPEQPALPAGAPPLLLALAAARQDWDGAYLDAYACYKNWDSRRLRDGEFGQHPAWMANMVVAAAAFRRGDVSPAPGRHRPEEAARPAGLPFGFRSAAFPAGGGPAVLSMPGNADHVVCGDGSEGNVLKVDAPRLKAVLGRLRGGRHRFGGVVIQPVFTDAGYSTIALLLMEGSSFGDAGRALLVATAGVANMGMGTRLERTLGRSRTRLDWGRAPTVIEPVGVELTLPGQVGEVFAYALDVRGQRGARLPVFPLGDDQVGISVGSEQGTLWHEVVWHERSRERESGRKGPGGER